MGDWTLTVDNLDMHPEVLTAENFKELIGQELLNTQNRLRGEIEGGKGANGAEIKPGGYSASYREMIERAKRGFAARDGKGKQAHKTENKLAQKDPNTVNLFLTGRMLTSWNIASIPGGAQLNFPNHQLAKVTGLLSRGFTGWCEWGQTDLTRLKAAVEKKAEELIKKMFTNRKG